MKILLVIDSSQGRFLSALFYGEKMLIKKRLNIIKKQLNNKESDLVNIENLRKLEKEKAIKKLEKYLTDPDIKFKRKDYKDLYYHLLYGKLKGRI